MLRFDKYVNPHTSPRKTAWVTAFEYIGIIIGIAPMALMVNWVLLPHAFVGGGLTGICSAIYYLTNGMFVELFPEYGGAIPVWLTTFVFNAILLLIAAYNEEESRLDAKIASEIDEIGIIKCCRRLSVYRKEYRASDAMTAEEIQKYYEVIDKFREYAGDECLINFILHAPNPF